MNILDPNDAENVAVQTRDSFVIANTRHTINHNKRFVDEHRVFKSFLQSCCFSFKNGKIAHFVRGKYSTNNLQEIEEFEAEIGFGEVSQHPHIFMDNAEMVIKKEQQQIPIEVLTAQIRAQLIAEMAANTAKTNDVGTSIAEPLKPASSTDIAAITANGVSSVPPVAKK